MTRLSQEVHKVRVAGVDEAGRGPLAGPVVAAAVILNVRRPIFGLADSKTLPPEERARLAVLIRTRALAWGVGWSDSEEIDTLNILQATLLAMRRALLRLPLHPTHVQVDGNCSPRLADLLGGCPHANALRAHPHRTLDRALHGTTERDPASQLIGDALRDQRRVDSREDLPRRPDGTNGCALSGFRSCGS